MILLYWCFNACLNIVHYLYQHNIDLFCCSIWFKCSFPICLNMPRFFSSTVVHWVSLKPRISASRTTWSTSEQSQVALRLQVSGQIVTQKPFEWNQDSLNCEVFIECPVVAFLRKCNRRQCLQWSTIVFYVDKEYKVEFFYGKIQNRNSIDGFFCGDYWRLQHLDCELFAIRNIAFRFARF